MSEPSIEALQEEVARLTDLVAAIRRGRDNREARREVHQQTIAADAWDEGAASCIWEVGGFIDRPANPYRTEKARTE